MVFLNVILMVINEYWEDETFEIQGVKKQNKKHFTLEAPPFWVFSKCYANYFYIFGKDN